MVGAAMACEGCKNEQRITSLEKDSERNQATHKEFFNKFEEININGARSDEKYMNILAVLSEVKAQVSQLLAKPSKRWDAAVMAAITAIVGIAIGYFIK